MHFPERRPDQTEERILPLINVVFLLLIFFMIAGSLTVTEPFEVKPPTSGGQEEDMPDSLVILISKSGQLALDNQPLGEADLLAALKTKLAQQPDTPITLKADANLNANKLVQLTHALYGVGVKKLRLLTEPAA